MNKASGRYLINCLDLTKPKNGDIIRLTKIDRKEDKMKERLKNAKKPQGEYGASVLDGMNERHNDGEVWGISKLRLSSAREILDIGCGGGRNIANFLELIPDAYVTGIDYSEVSVEKSIEYNKTAIEKGAAEVLQGDVSRLPFKSPRFDIITAFETIYFWPEIEKCFRDIFGALNDGGQFLVCNEVSSREQFEEWGKLVGMNFYSQEDIEKLMQISGFKSTKSFRHEDGRWMCVIGYK